MGRKIEKKNNLQTLQIRLPSEHINEIDILIQRQIYPSRSEAIRDMVRNALFSVYSYLRGEENGKAWKTEKKADRSSKDRVK